MTTSLRARPAASEFAPYYGKYIATVGDGDIVALLRESGREVDTVLAGVDESRGGYRYADGKWSVREVLGHLIDAERIFSYRALRIARGDTTPLPGFDQDPYVATSNAEARTVADLRDELRVVRESTVKLFASLADDAWTRVGTASDNPVSVRALAYITLGHTTHHLGILRERYGL